jgi:hypothetical protein
MSMITFRLARELQEKRQAEEQPQAVVESEVTAQSGSDEPTESSDQQEPEAAKEKSVDAKQVEAKAAPAKAATSSSATVKAKPSVTPGK